MVLPFHSPTARIAWHYCSILGNIPPCFWGICRIQVCLALSSCWWSDSTLTLCLFSASVQEILLCFLFEEFLVLPGEYLNNNFIKYIIFALCIWLFVNAPFIHIICLIHQSLTQLYNWTVRFVPAFCWTLPSKIWVSTSILSSVSHKSLSIKNYHKNV